MYLQQDIIKYIILAGQLYAHIAGIVLQVIASYTKSIITSGLHNQTGAFIKQNNYLYIAPIDFIII